MLTGLFIEIKNIYFLLFILYRQKINGTHHMPITKFQKQTFYDCKKQNKKIFTQLCCHMYLSKNIFLNLCVDFFSAQLDFFFLGNNVLSHTFFLSFWFSGIINSHFQYNLSIQHNKNFCNI